MVNLHLQTTILKGLIVESRITHSHLLGNSKVTGRMDMVVVTVSLVLNQVMASLSQILNLDMITKAMILHPHKEIQIKMELLHPMGVQAGSTSGRPAAAAGPSPVLPPTANQQGYSGQQSTTPSYGSPGGSQPGYGVPPTQPGYWSQHPPQAGYGHR